MLGGCARPSRFGIAHRLSGGNHPHPPSSRGQALTFPLDGLTGVGKVLDEHKRVSKKLCNGLTVLASNPVMAA